MYSFNFCRIELSIFIATISLCTNPGHGLLCHCDTHCPDDHKNFTCVTEYKCFATIQFTEGTIDQTRHHGCMPGAHDGGRLQCTVKGQHHTPIKVLCCNDGDLCNMDLDPTLAPDEVKTYINKFTEEKKNTTGPNHTQGIALVISVTVCVMLLVIIVTYLYLRYRQITSKRRREDARRVFIANGTEPVGSMGELLYSSSGTGSGVPLLEQRTIASEVNIHHEIGRGRFSIVYKAYWKHQCVAVKYVDICDELSWQREFEMYQTAYLCHENILGFIAADIQEALLNQEVQRLIITAYHPYGSLHDFLQTHSFDFRILYRLAYSAISGLWYIHRTIHGSRGKPPIAHRDIKSKNILVKDNLQCCIGDLGLAVKSDPETKEMDFGNNPRLSTIRYMAPEILSAPYPCTNSHSFVTYQKADMFAFGLVLWEITRRYEVLGEPEQYQLPYTGHVRLDPTINEMHDVCKKQETLTLPSRYGQDPHAKVMINLMKECWRFSPTARLTSLYLKKALQKRVQDQDSEESTDSGTIGTT